MRCDVFRCMISWWDLLMRVHAFCYIICLWDVMHLSSYEIALWEFMLFVPQWDIVMRFVGFRIFIFISDFLLRLYAVVAVVRFVLAMLCFVGSITLVCEFMLLGCYDISLGDTMVCEHEDISWDYLMSFHAFRDPTRFPCKICCCLLHNFTYAIFWYEIACFLSVVRCPYEITCLWPQIFQ